MLFALHSSGNGFEVNGFTVLEAVTFRRSAKTDGNVHYKIKFCISEYNFVLDTIVYKTFKCLYVGIVSKTFASYNSVDSGEAK